MRVLGSLKGFGCPFWCFGSFWWSLRKLSSKGQCHQWGNSTDGKVSDCGVGEGCFLGVFSCY